MTPAEIDAKVGCGLVALTFDGIDGRPCETVGRITKACKRHGFHDGNGSWSLYAGEGWVPSHTFGFVKKGKRKIVGHRAENVVTMRDAGGRP